MGMIDGRTRLVGLMGWPVAHSFSPAMHNAAADALGINLAYVPLPVPPGEVETAVRGLASLGFLGANVTVPHKQAVIPWLDELEDGARIIGAVNTIVVQRAHHTIRLKGYNTDWAGFLADLEALQVAVRDRDCLVLGAGGSARAVVYALAAAGGRVWVLARREEQAVALVAALSPHFRGGVLQGGALTALRDVIGELTGPLVVNTTPLGMMPNTGGSVWPEDVPFPRGAFAYDLVYNPPETRFMRQSHRVGCRSAGGLGMLVAQGALAFRLWTGAVPDTAVMRRAIRRLLAERNS